MPRKPSLSPSKLSTFLVCPTKYMWTYVDPRGRFYVRSKSYFSFGASLHRVLEKFHDQRETGVTTVADAIRTYEESWIDAGFSSAEEMSNAYGEGLELIRGHVEEEIRAPRGGKTIMVERFFRSDFGTFTLVGRIDRLDEYPDGSLEIIDYKSGRGGVTPEQVAEDLAMGLYQVLVRRQFPGRPVRATIIALRTNVEATASLLDSEIEQLVADVTELGELILNRNWEEEVPVAKEVCPHCDFLPLCTRHPEFDYRPEIAVEAA